MAGPLDLRGRAIISDGASQTLRTIRGNLDAVGNSATRLQRAMNGVQTLGRQARNLTAGIAGGAAAAGGVVSQVIDKTKAFNEAKFGYGFARITDFIKDGKLDLAGWKKEMDGAADKAKVAARAFGTLPSITMKAREEVEKLGFKGKESESIFSAALGLHLSEPTALASGEAAKYVGAVYRAYTKQREELAKRLGKDADDPAFVEAYIKGLAGKAAVAGAESALGPAEIVEGMRQYAPQWAAMGVDYNFALAMLAHGSNYGFRAPELGTAFKSMVSRLNNPTAPGLGVLNRAGINLNDYRVATPADPTKAAGQLNSLLLGAPFAGKGGMGRKQHIKDMLDFAYRNGQTATPDFQNALTNEVMGMLGSGWAGRIDEVRQAVGNATMTSGGGLNLPAVLKAMRDAKLTVGEIATAFEGRHVSRYTPTFQYYEQLMAMYEKLQNTDGSVMDAVVDGRKASEAGKTDRLSGSWEELMVALEQSGGIVDMFKTKITQLNDALAGLPTGALTAITGTVLSLAAVAGGGMLLGTLRGVGAGLGLGAGKVPLTDSQRMIAGMSAAGGAGGGWLSRIGRGLGMGLLYGMPMLGQGLAVRSLWQSGGGLLGAIRAGGLRAGMLVPGLGTGFALASLLASAYGGIQKYRETGSVLEGAKEGSGWNALTGLFGWMFGSQAQAAPAVPPGASVPSVGAPGGEGGGPLAGMEENVRAAVERMRAALAIDLSGEGNQAGASYVAAFSAQMEQAVSAAEGAAARMRASLGRVELNTGPAMGGAR